MSNPLAELIGDAHAFEDLDEFRHGIPGLLRRFVPADVASYNEMDDDPDGSWWISDPFLQITPDQEERFAELAEENPVLAYTRRTLDGRPRRISDFLSREEFHRLRLYREFYGQIAAEYQVALCLPSRPPVVIGLALTRAEEDFSDREVAMLGAARPHLIQAYRNAELAAAREATIAALEASLEDVGTAVIVVDRYGRVDMATPAGRRLIDGRLGGDKGRLSADVLARLAARREAGTPATEPLLVEDGEEQISLRVLRGPEGGSEMLVIEPEASGLSVPSLQALGLTRRQAEALRWVALGRRGPDVARLMGLSPRTVEKHLQGVYARLGVDNSSQAAATAWSAVGVRLPEA
ncbi:MAG TPA: helix-turn-helix transcriptional regulator [Solirubrobacterales bacterium]|nr:helix-turn-helix transcriptional regulator [Solirubrobacterales bacterium]